MIGALIRLVVRGLLAFGLVVAVLLGVALYRSGRFPFQDRIQEAAIIASAKAALALHHELAHREIRVEANAGRVVLRGQVASEAERAAAEEIAEGIRGVTAVENLLEIDSRIGPSETAEEPSRSLGETLDDVALLAKVRAALALDRETKSLDLEVTVRDRVVSLRGKVPSEELKRRVLRRVEGIEGVARVEDALELSD